MMQARDPGLSPLLSPLPWEPFHLHIQCMRRSGVTPLCACNGLLQSTVLISA
jgi:hypothetical protein